MVRRFDAVIFDMDGVIADSEPIHGAAFDAVLRPLGHVIGPDLRASLMGHGHHENWQTLSDYFSLTNVEMLRDAYVEALLAGLAETRETLPGVREVIDALRHAGVRIALASSSQDTWIDALLSGLGLSHAFDAVVSGSHVEHAKPAPDVYLLAAKTVGVPPAHCLVIEDTPAGVEAAKSAGMSAVQTRSASSAFPPIEGADLVLDSLLEFDLTVLDA
jgi:HAD superfamily hydrolase (TIGR01509 family)